MHRHWWPTSNKQRAMSYYEHIKMSKRFAATSFWLCGSTVWICGVDPFLAMNFWPESQERCAREQARLRVRESRSKSPSRICFAQVAACFLLRKEPLKSAFHVHSNRVETWLIKRPAIAAFLHCQVPERDSAMIRHPASLIRSLALQRPF